MSKRDPTREELLHKAFKDRVLCLTEDAKRLGYVSTFARVAGHYYVKTWKAGLIVWRAEIT